MGVEGVDEGASGAQHSRKLVSFTLSGKEQHYSVFYKLLLKKIIAVLNNIKDGTLFFISLCRSTL